MADTLNHEDGAKLGRMANVTGITARAMIETGLRGHEAVATELRRRVL